MRYVIEEWDARKQDWIQNGGGSLGSRLTIPLALGSHDATPGEAQWDRAELRYGIHDPEPEIVQVYRYPKLEPVVDLGPERKEKWLWKVDEHLGGVRLSFMLNTRTTVAQTFELTHDQAKALAYHLSGADPKPTPIEPLPDPPPQRLFLSSEVVTKINELIAAVNRMEAKA